MNYANIQGINELWSLAITRNNQWLFEIFNLFDIVVVISLTLYVQY